MFREETERWKEREEQKKEGREGKKESEGRRARRHVMTEPAVQNRLCAAACSPGM